MSRAVNLLSSGAGLGPVANGVTRDHVRRCGYLGVCDDFLTFFSSDGHCPLTFGCRERTRPPTCPPTTLTRLTLAHSTLSPASDSRPMSTQEPVIAGSNETTESVRVEPSTVPPPERSSAKDVSQIPDYSPGEHVTELPAESGQATSDDALSIPSKRDMNIPSVTPTILSGSVHGADATPFVSVAALNF